MAQITLGQLIRKKLFAPLVQRLVMALETPLLIEDLGGELLIATDGAAGDLRYPVIAQGDTIGWVFGNEKAELLASLLAYHAELEVERKNLGSETLHKYKEITLLYDMADKIPACMERSEIISILIEQIRQVIRFSGLSVMLLNKESGKLEVSACLGDEYATGTVIEPVGIMAGVWSSGKGEIVNDVHADTRFVQRPYRVSSLMCAPLKSKESLVGIIELTSAEPTVYAAEDLKLFSTLASQAAVQIENSVLYQELKNAFYTMVYTLAETIEKRDPYTGNHTKRVMEYSLAVGKTIGMSEDELTRLELAAVLHDIGKIGVRDNVLLKQGKLTDDEFHQIMQHPELGGQILSRISQLRDIIPGVVQHHERFDGKGYPEGIFGEQIDLAARIIAIADTFDAMTTDRPYRRGFSFEEAFEEVRRNSGTQFDPKIVDAFFETDVMEAFFKASASLTLRAAPG